MSATWSETEVRLVVQRSFTVSQVLRALGLHVSSGNYRTFYRYAALWELDCSHFSGSRVGLTYRIPYQPVALEALLIMNGTGSTFNLKKRLIKEGLLQYACCVCGISDWLGSPLALQLDHLNGNSRDHRLHNLRLLCPNCHSQTSNYAGRAKRAAPCVNCGNPVVRGKCRSCSLKYVKPTKIKWPSKEELQILVWEQPFTKVAEHLGVTDRAVQKRCVKQGIPFPRKGYWLKKPC